MIQAAQRLKTELAGQVEALKKEREELDHRETQLASVSNIMCCEYFLTVSLITCIYFQERLAFAREHREFEESQCAHSTSLYHHTKPILTSQSTNIEYTCTCILI